MKRAIQLVNSGVVKGFTAEIIKDAANNNPEQFRKYLSEIAEQARHKHSVRATVNIYGQELVNIATQLN